MSRAFLPPQALAPAATDVKYALAALNGDHVVPPRAPPAYVEALFDLRSRRRFLRADGRRGAPLPAGWDLAGVPPQNASAGRAAAADDDADGAATDANDAGDAPKAKASVPDATVLETISAILHGDRAKDSSVQRFATVEAAIKAVRENRTEFTVPPDDPAVAAAAAAAAAAATAPATAAKQALAPLNETVQDEPALFSQVHGIFFDGPLLDVVVSTVRLALDIEPGDAGGRWLDVLELGCGDGKAGPLLRGLANRLHCVDLSPGALALARRRRAYDELERGEFVSTARALLPDSQDLVVAVDAVPYLGELGDFFGAVVSVLRPGGVAVFNADVLRAPPKKAQHFIHPAPKAPPDAAAANANANTNANDGAAPVERSDRDQAPTRFQLAFTGRWHHRIEYVKTLAALHGLTMVGPAQTITANEPRLIWNAQSQKATTVAKAATRKESKETDPATCIYAFRKEYA